MRRASPPRSFLLTAAILCASSLHAQTQTATLSGEIKAPSGFGITGAIVRLESNQATFETTAFSQGRFALHLTPGNYTLKVSAEGFLAHQQSLSVQPDTSNHETVLSPLQLEYALNPRVDCLSICDAPASLSGLVTDISGAVVPNAIVRLEWPQNKITLEATTGDDGRYFLYTHPGNYTLTVHSPGFFMPTQSLQLDSDTPPLKANFQLNVAYCTNCVQVEPVSFPHELALLQNSDPTQTLPLHPLPPLRLRSRRLPN